MSPGPLAGGKAVAQRGAERPGRELRCVAVQDDRHLGPDQGPHAPAPINVELGVDEGRADVLAADLAGIEAPPTAREAAALPAGRDDDPVPAGWGQERLQASIRALTDVLRRWYRPTERGHARALHILGKKLEESDAAKAEECFRWAARTGDIDAIVASNDLNFSSANLDSEEGVTLHLK